MNALKTKKASLALLLGLLLSQPGCVAGIISWPLWAIGSVVGVSGLVIGTEGQFHHDIDLVGMGDLLVVSGFFLDTQNPGRSDALNELPMTEASAQAAGVTIQDIRSYNHHLEHIRAVGMEIFQDIKAQVNRTELRNFTALAQVHSDPELQGLVQKYGFESTAAFLSTFSSQKLPRTSLEHFARSQNLSEAEAKLLLFYGFNVVTE
jgi:hypothetical protein